MSHYSFINIKGVFFFSIGVDESVPSYRVLVVLFPGKLEKTEP